MDEPISLPNVIAARDMTVPPQVAFDRLELNRILSVYGRMVAAGAVPITWMAVMAEWQRDWPPHASLHLQRGYRQVSSHNPRDAPAIAQQRRRS